ncbi:aldehyde dehydrogenase family protein [Acanthopleuribacter pedis]|uniref:Aldehyde dehydrogenase family protein n=1 Tax=Acanthopleuribacter pedis TaxID=442870 RepID=A0A8J7QAA9_9BACT|nr:aldehyde dehydrogenase family protein [Acanthopleuribacter pedis]MBO1322837.1 aldehyde dehydrogenase family protein [Acanthopleuribacter pedis]
MKANYINGQWRESDASLPNINPSDLADKVDDFAVATGDDVAEAVAAAREAAPAWAGLTPQARADILETIGREIVERKQELGDLLAREEGKTLAEGIGEVNRAGQIFKYFAGEALRCEGSILDSIRPGVSVEVTREPLGVVGAVTPWNFPSAIPAWKMAPALAFGNTVVLKPAEWAPASAWALIDICSRTDMPAGTVNLVMGSGIDTGAALVGNPDLNALSFTGSRTTGNHIAKTCLAQNTKFQLEMGGKNPLIVLDDADLDQAVKVAVNGAFFSSGQRCTASSRLIVTEGIHDRFVSHLKEALAGLVVGDARDPSTHIGPVIDGRQLEKILATIEEGRREGARLVFGGDRVKAAKEGHYLSPTLFCDTHNTMVINREEIFGPVATVQCVKNYEEALAVANDSEYGLSAGICTNSLKFANHFKRHAQAGMIMVNLPTAGVDYHVPFGGTKQSSYGHREQGREAIGFYTSVKTTYLGC